MTRNRVRKYRYRPMLEALEQRLAPAIFNLSPTPDGVAGSLRQAILDANANDEADTIILAAGTYALSVAGADEDAGATGDLDITADLTLIGAGAAVTVLDASGIPGGDRVLHVLGSITVGISGVTILGGNVLGDGGGILNVQGALTVTDSTIRDNTATAPEDSDSGKGGGVYHASDFPGMLVLNNSTVSGNRAQSGGGIYNARTARLTNSTISGNQSSVGGGIYNEYGGSVTLNHVTLTDNSGVEFGGIANLGEFRLANSLVANNAPGNNRGDSSFLSDGHNLDSDGTLNLTGTGDLENLDPRLGPLQDNGGPTFTHALLADSPAIDAADIDSIIPADQRGVDRPVDGNDDDLAQSDIGAFEFVVPDPPDLTSISGQKFEDANGNGVRDAGEPGLNGWTIELVHAATGEVVATQTTHTIDGHPGQYAFEDVAPGTYRVREVAQPGYRQTSPRDLDLTTPNDVSIGRNPHSVTAADLDGDGHVDLAVANTGSGTVSVLLNSGGGSFAAPVPFQVGNEPRSVTAADLDGDGLPDLAVANGVSGTVSVLLNTGDGSFGAPVHLQVGNEPRSVTAADLNGDGFLDLAVANSGSATVTVLLNTGRGSFAAPVHRQVGSRPYSVTPADVNGDGFLDLAVANIGSGTVMVLLNNGGGSFAAAPIHLPVGNAPLSVTAADLDGDGLPDLAVANLNSSTVSVLLNTGGGSFAAPVHLPVGLGPVSVTAADLDGDGLLDLAVANTSNSKISVLLNTGGGSFAAQVLLPARSNPQSVTAADLDGDGHLDLAVANFNSDSVSVLLNRTGSYTRTVVAGDQITGLDFGNLTLLQKVAGTEPLIEAPEGTTFQLAVRYTTSDLDHTLPGLGLRLHFDSSALRFEGLSGVLPTDLVRQQVLSDLDDFDADPATDRFLLIGWADIAGNWPGQQLPATLFQAQFALVSGVQAGATSTVRFTASSTAASHGFEGTPIVIQVVPTTLDVDRNGVADALTDGLLIRRYLLNFRDQRLVENAVAADATRINPAALVAYLDTVRPLILDVDANGVAEEATDGVLIQRYLFGFRGDELVAGVVDPAGRRTEPLAIVAFLDPFNPHPLLSQPLPVISGTVFLDNNANGVRDPGDLGRDGVTVELVDRRTGQVVFTQQTRAIDGNGDGAIDPQTERGRYQFVVAPGDYEVREVTPPNSTPTFPFGSTERVSVNAAGLEGDGRSDAPVLSDDGRFVAFHSDATNLVPGDTNGESDVFVFDRQTGLIERISSGATGAQGDGASSAPALSGDGRFVAFVSFATNLVPGDTNGRADVFVFDRQTGLIERISSGATGAQANNPSLDPVLSGDGRFVAFHSDATNLVPGDTNGRPDVFVFDRQTGLIQRVSNSFTGAQGDGSSTAPALSGDGRFVAFASLATNLVPGDTNGTPDVFVFDRQTGLIERISGATGAQGDGFSDDAVLSGDGRFVAFESSATNLVPGDTNGQVDVFVFDRQTGLLQRISNGAAGVLGNGISSDAALSGDGRFVAFGSLATNLVPGGDTNGLSDVFVYANFGTHAVTVAAGERIEGLDFGNYTTFLFTVAVGIVFEIPPGGQTGSVVVPPGGGVRGTGRVLGNLFNAGQAMPGTSPGVLIVDGDYTQTATGELLIELGGLLPELQYDRLQVTGVAALDGILSVELVSGFTPQEGDRFQILTFGSRTGEFHTITGLDLGNDLVLVPTFETGGLTLVVVNVSNVAPVAAVDGDSNGVRGQPRNFVLSATDPSSADTAAGFTFQIAWGDGSSQVVSGLSGIAVDHVYTAGGTYNVQVTATDTNNGVGGAVTHVITIQAVEMQGGTLAVGGSLLRDLIRFRPAASRGDVTVLINGAAQGTFHPDRILAYAQAGNDDIRLVARQVLRTQVSHAVPAFLFGGDGDDILNATGSIASNVLLGGADNDRLKGGRGRDLLIGGPGADNLAGRARDDILIAGATAFDANAAALSSIMAEWTTPRGYEVRVTNLRGTGSGPRSNGDFFLTATGPDRTVFDDGAPDVLAGSGARDWLFANLDLGVLDVLLDRVLSEFAEDLS